jgi:hypothetical protein
MWVVLGIVICLFLAYYYVDIEDFIDSLRDPTSKGLGGVRAAIPPSRIVLSGTDDSGTVQVTLDRSNLPALECTVETWTGTDTTVAPSSSYDLKLTGCAASGDGSKFSATTSYGFFEPRVSITLHTLTPVLATATVAVSNAWPENSVTVLNVSSADCAVARQFIVDCKFPAIGAAS